MDNRISIVGAGLAGSEAALQLANRGFDIELYEMRPETQTPVHKTGYCAELVCSNSLKSLKPETAAGMLKRELEVLGSELFDVALETAVPAGGALAVDREAFARAITERVRAHDHIRLIQHEVASIDELASSSAVVLATGPLTGEALAQDLLNLTGRDQLAFYDAAAPIVMADSLDNEVLFRQSRYEEQKAEGGELQGDYLNAPFSKAEYEHFIDELLSAERVVSKDFETSDLFQACQPIEEIARAGRDAPRFGPLKPVGLTDPRTGKRPWAALQLRAENAACTSYNLVGFQTNLRFSEQKRVFSLIPGLQHAEFARYGVMHRNTFVNAPHLLDGSLRLRSDAVSQDVPVFLAGQLCGTEGYCEAIRSGLHVGLSVAALLADVKIPPVPKETAFGALIAYACNPETVHYQPMHVNFGLMEPLDPPVRNKRERYRAYASRGEKALLSYCDQLKSMGILG